MASAFTLPEGVFHLRPAQAGARPVFPLGLGERGLHEVCERQFGDMAALTGFVLAAARPRRGCVLRVAQAGLARQHGDLLAAGLDTAWPVPRPVLTVRPRRLGDVLWTIEEAVRSNAVGLVLAEVEDLDFTASRRLALAAGRHGVPVILLMPHTRNGATAATARWRVCPRPSAANRFDPRAPGPARWQAVLERTRSAPHMAGHVFDLEWNDETLSLSVVSGLAAHAPAPGADSRSQPSRNPAASSGGPHPEPSPDLRRTG